MKIEGEKNYGIVATICTINNREMSQIAEMGSKIRNILENHKKEGGKKEYLNDDDLERIMVILNVISREWRDDEESAFDKALAELHKSQHEQLMPQTVDYGLIEDKLKTIDDVCFGVS
jgi:hypothetical protein